MLLKSFGLFRGSLQVYKYTLLLLKPLWAFSQLKYTNIVIRTLFKSK